MKVRDILVLTEMAMTRSDFMRKFENRLKGAFGEYMCNEISKKMKRPAYWDKEVDTLVYKMKFFFNDKQTPLKVKGNSDDVRIKAIKEVLNDFDDVSYVRWAKEKVQGYASFRDIALEIDVLEIDSDAELDKFVKEYFPPEYHDFRKDRE